MKSISLKSLITENNKFNGKEIWPSELDASDFGNKIFDVRKLKKNKFYILLDLGMNNWHGEYKLVSIVSNNLKYVFKDTTHSNGNDITYTNKEIISAIRNGEIYEQK